MAKKQVQKNQIYFIWNKKDLKKQLKIIKFQQLFTIFKVLNAIKKVKKYQTLDQKHQQQILKEIEEETENQDNQYNYQNQNQENNINEQIRNRQNSKDNKSNTNQNILDYQKLVNLKQAINLTEYFNSPRDQALCGSCYSFPVTATIQYQYKKLFNLTIKLSEQQLIDCGSGQLQQIKKQRELQIKGQYINKYDKINGCQGANLLRGFQFVQKYGIIQEKYYPYRSQAGISYYCDLNITGLQELYFGTNKQKMNNSIQLPQRYKIKGLRKIPYGNCKAIQFQLAKGNAISAVINAANVNNHKNYSQPFSDCVQTDLNHAITIIGQTQNQDWIIRNSWGQGWGNNGYFIIKKGNTCGICLLATVPYLENDQVQRIIEEQKSKKK